MKTILKFQLPTDERQQLVEMPAGEIVHVALQPDLELGAMTIQIWALVDQGAPDTIRRFLVTKTGQPIPAGARFIATLATVALAMTPEGPQPKNVVTHVLELV